VTGLLDSCHFQLVSRTVSLLASTTQERWSAGSGFGGMEEAVLPAGPGGAQEREACNAAVGR